MEDNLVDGDDVIFGSLRFYGLAFVHLDESNAVRIILYDRDLAKDLVLLGDDNADKTARKYMRAGDTFIVYKFDRIGRSLKDLVNIFADLQKRDISLISLKDNIDASSNTGKFMMNVFAALAEFERSIIIERCQSGRAEAKRKGKQFGRPKGIPKDKIAACAYVGRNSVSSIGQNQSLTSLLN